jgi:hypothetical protein
VQRMEGDRHDNVKLSSYSATNTETNGVKSLS